MRLIAPPLPPASRPSRTTSRPGPISPEPSSTTEVEPQLEQSSLSGLDASLVLAAPEPLRQVELVESGRRGHHLRG